LRRRRDQEDLSVQLLRGTEPFVRVGHRGAPLAAHENTLASIEAAAALGVDVVELDVIALGDGTLVLGHSLAEKHANAPRLDEALSLVDELDLGVQLDVKLPGYEARLAAAVLRHDLLERCFASSTSLRTLRALREAEPDLARSLTYPDDRFGLTNRRLVRPFTAPGLAGLRHMLPLRLPRWLRNVGAVAATLNWKVVSAPVLERCHSLGIAVYVWTVNDAELVASLDSLGADGIISDDPRLFARPVLT
jgi:glycerophosphoryl diester phosphodiesterase